MPEVLEKRTLPDQTDLIKDKEPRSKYSTCFCVSFVRSAKLKCSRQHLCAEKRRTTVSVPAGTTTSSANDNQDTEKEVVDESHNSSEK